MKKQLRSFFCAFRGVGDAVRGEAHLRFHLVAAFYVLLFSPFFELSAAQYAVLVLLMGAVMAAEMINTAVERVCNAVTEERNENIRLAKDIAAGAVLVLSAAAVAVAALFFLDGAAWLRVWDFFMQKPWLLPPLVCSAAVSVVFGRRVTGRKRGDNRDSKG